MQRWEHAVADFTRLEGAVAELDRLGAEGWKRRAWSQRGVRDGASCIPQSPQKRPRPESAQLGACDGPGRRVA